MITQKLEEDRPEEAEAYAKQGLDILDNYRTSFQLKGSLHFLLGKIYLKSGKLEDADLYAREAIHYYSVASNKKPYFQIKCAEALMLRGQANLQLGRYQDAHLYFVQAKNSSESFFQKSGPEFLSQYVESLICLGDISYLLNEKEEAHRKYTQALDLMLTIDHETNRVTALTYNRMVRYYLGEGNLSMASRFLREEEKAVKALSDKLPNLLCQLNEARFLELRGSKLAAFQGYQAVLNQAQNLDYPYWQAVGLYAMGRIRQGDKKKFEEADSYFNNGLRIAKKINSGGLVLQGNLALSSLYESTGRLKKALSYYHEYLRVMNEMFVKMASSPQNTDLSILKKWEELQEPEYFERLEEELNSQADIFENRYYIALIVLISLALLGALSVIYFNFYRKKHLELQENKRELECTMKELQQTVVKLEESKEKLEESNQVQNKLMTVIAHDLKGQFGGIQQFAEIMQEDLESLSQEFLARFANEFYASAKKINSLFDNLIQWARSQIGEVVFRGNIHNLSQIATEALQLQEERAREKRIALHCRVPEDMEVYTDVNMLNFILRNLITNGIKFTPQGGLLIVHAVALEDEVCVSVIDNGIGMTEAIQKRLFDIGKGSSREGTDREKGTGIGLALCAEFAAKMNTRLEVNSVPDQGTTISFKLPVVLEENIVEENELFPIKSGS